MASLLNILGLSIAISVFIIIMTQLNWEYGYNKSIKDSENIYRGVVKWGGRLSINMSRPMGEHIAKEIPQIESYAVIWDWNNARYRRADQGEAAKEVTESYTRVNPEFFDLTALNIIEGNNTDFAAKNTAVISRSFAQKMWGDSSPVGEILYNDWNDTLRVVAVYEDIPSNVTFKNSVYINIADYCLNNNSEWGFRYYYKLGSDASIEEVTKKARILLYDRFFSGGDQSKYDEEFFSFEPIEDIYFSHTPSPNDQGNKTLSLVLLAVAILIILVAVINYINFFMALVPVRIRAVNINKVFGTPTSALRANFIGEAAGMMILSFGVALFIVETAASSFVAEFAEASFKFGDNIFVDSITFTLMVSIGVVAGLFPALYITKFTPAMVLKGSFGRSRQGQRMRSVLTAFQFVVSIVLIIVSLFITLQNRYMQSADYGFNRDRLISVNVGSQIASKPAAFLSELRKNPSIVDVAYGDGSILNVGMGWGRTLNGESVNFQCFPVSWNFPQFMGIEMVEGRSFIEEDASKIGGTIIFNETAAKRFGFKIGDFIQGHSNKEQAEVVGIAKDFNFTSLANEITPMALYEFGSEGWRVPSNAYVRITPTADLREVSDYISTVMTSLNENIKPEHVKVRAFNQTVENLYVKEQRISEIITLFSIVAILISLVGVFGLVVFETQYRKKEIALRKIHGSTVEQVLTMFNRKFIRIVAISFVIAVPLAWYSVSSWLGGFAFRVSIYWWVFAVALLLVLLITLLTVTIQTYRAATENPINSLKSE